MVYIFLGIAAYTALRGLFGAFRVGVLEKASITLPQGQDLSALLDISRALLAALLGGWYVSGFLGHVEEDRTHCRRRSSPPKPGRMESFSFVAPFAYTLEYLMLWTDKSKIIT